MHVVFDVHTKEDQIVLTQAELEWRRNGVGSSEIGVLAGHGMYRNVTPITIWESKLYGSDGETTDEVLFAFDIEG